MHNNLKEIIEKRGLKNKFVADQLNVSPQAFSAWINNRSNPSLETAYKIAKVLNCSVTDIWKEE